MEGGIVGFRCLGDRCALAFTSGSDSPLTLPTFSTLVPSVSTNAFLGLHPIRGPQASLHFGMSVALT